MKQALPYILVIGGATASAAVVMALLVFFVPGLFQPPAAESPLAPATDSTVSVQDSLRPIPDTSGVAAPAVPPDSIALLRTALAEERARNDRLDQQLQSLRDSLRTAAAPRDSLPVRDWKAMAKVIEAMAPDKAARVMKDIPDQQVRDMLLSLKKKQAAKILSSLEPDRAARIAR